MKQRATQEVINRYGNKIISDVNGDRKINRFALGQIIFFSLEERTWLENLLHPIIKKRIEDDLYKNRELPVIAMIIPLLYEANFLDLCNETWLIYCKLNQQYERLMNRNQFTYNQAKARIESQISLEKKKCLADKVIDNSNELKMCFNQIDALL